MPRRRGIKGEATQGEEPNWEPLVNAVGERVTRDFMWMFEVELTDGRSLQAYKILDSQAAVDRLYESECQGARDSEAGPGTEAGA